MSHRDDTKAAADEQPAAESTAGAGQQDALSDEALEEVAGGTNGCWEPPSDTDVAGDSKPKFGW